MGAPVIRVRKRRKFWIKLGWILFTLETDFTYNTCPDNGDNLYIVFGKAYGALVGTRERLVYPRSNITDKFVGRTDQNESRFPQDFCFLHIIREVKVD